MKKLIYLFIAILISIQNYAQSSCSNPYTLQNDSTYELTTSDTMWFEFVASETNQYISYYIQDTVSPIDTAIIELKQNCTGAVLQATITENSSGRANFKQLVVGNLYKFKVSSIVNNENIQIQLENTPDGLSDICLTIPPKCQLVCNGSFEDLAQGVNANTSGFPPLRRINKWDGPNQAVIPSPDGYWFDGNNGSVPVGSGYTAPYGRNGSYGLAGIIAGYNSLPSSPPYREYIQTQLTSQIPPNTIFIASMWVRQFERYQEGIHKLGMLFTDVAIQQSPSNTIGSGGNGAFNLTPQVEGNGQNIGPQWIQIAGVIQNNTSSNWEYLTIGNFDITGPSSNTLPGFGGAYYFIDDVSVIEMPTAGVDQTVCLGNSVSLGAGCPLPNNIGVGISWMDSQGNIVSNSYPYTFTPTQNETYTLHVTVNGTTYTDQVNVQVVCCLANIDFDLNGTTNASAAFGGSNVVYQKDIVINGTLQIDQDMTFDDCNIYLGNQSKIVVSSSTQLNLLNSLLESCDGINMWKGIELPAQSCKIYSFGSTIREAELGIEAIDGAPVTLELSYFEDCYKGVFLAPFNGTHPAYFKGNTFITSNTLLKPYNGLLRGKSGIEIKDVQKVQIGVPSNLENTNIFSNLDYGIHALRSNTEVYTNKFINNFCGVYANGDFANSQTFFRLDVGSHNFGGGDNTFIDNFVGIYTTNGFQGYIWKNNFVENLSAVNIRNQPDGSYFEISDNEFQNNDYGIKMANIVKPLSFIENNLFNCNSTTPGEFAIIFDNIAPPSTTWVPTPPQGYNGTFRIKDNTIKHYDNGIQISNLSKPIIKNTKISDIPSYWSTPTHGIRLFNCPDASIEDNEIAGTSSSLWAGHGIASDFAVGNLIKGNCVKNVGRAIWLGGMSNGVKVRSNLMEDCNTGVFANWAFIGNQGWAYYFGTQGIILPSDNVWQGSFTNHLYNHQTVMPGGNAFTLRASGSAHFVPGHYPNNFQSNSYPSDSMKVWSSYIADGSLYYGDARCLTFGWTLQPPPESNQIFEAEQIAIMADTSHMQVWSPQGEAQEWLLNQAMYRDLVQDTVNILSSATLSAFMDSILAGNIDEIEGIDEYIRLGQETGDLQSIATAKALNNVLSGTELPAQTTLDFNAIYIAELEEQDGSIELDNTALQTLNIIAARCPYIYGTAVYQARALLAAADTGYQHILTACELGYQNGTAKMDGQPTDAEVNPVGGAQKSILRLFPNPAQEEVMVMFTSATLQEATLYIADATGRQVYSTRVPANRNTAIALPPLANGLYLCTVVDGSQQVVIHEKLLIQK